MAKIDLSKLEMTEKKTTERKVQEPLEADHPVVEALQALNDAERRISYRGFAALCVAAGEHQGGFNPRLFGLLNRMPNQLDALVCRPDGTQNSKKHKEHPANANGWDVVDSVEELSAIIGSEESDES